MSNTASSYCLYEEGEVIDDAKLYSSAPAGKVIALYWYHCRAYDYEQRKLNLSGELRGADSTTKEERS